MKEATKNSGTAKSKKTSSASRSGSAGAKSKTTRAAAGTSRSATAKKTQAKSARAGGSAKSATARTAASPKSTRTAREHTSLPEKAVSRVTFDHDEIRRWAEERKGQPSCVRGTGDKGDIGMLRIDFPGFSGQKSLQPISWDDWFEKFDERNLALLYQEETARGQKSNFNKIVSRETAEEATKPKVRRAGGR